MTTTIPATSVFSHPWWDDAIAQAHQLAGEVQARQRVTLDRTAGRPDGPIGRWVVSLADDAPRRGHLHLVTDTTPARRAASEFFTDRVDAALIRYADDLVLELAEVTETYGYVLDGDQVIGTLGAPEPIPDLGVARWVARGADIGYEFTAATEPCS